MKRSRLAIIAVSVPLVLLLSPMLFSTAGIASATSTSKNTITIQRDAQYDLFGTELQVGLVVSCKKGKVAGETGLVDVSVTQSPPETPYPVTFGDGGNIVVCDGKPHYATVTIMGAGYDGGRARATATLIPPVGAGSPVTRSADIYIVAN